MESLEQYQEKFKNTSKKDLHKLMTELEREFNIPMLNDEEFNKKHPRLMEFYKEISSKRWEE
jgi:hypothetical protein